MLVKLNIGWERMGFHDVKAKAVWGLYDPTNGVTWWVRSSPTQCFQARVQSDSGGKGDQTSPTEGSESESPGILIPAGASS